MKKNLLLLLIFGVMLTFGIIDTIDGVTFPIIKNLFEVSDISYGLMGMISTGLAFVFGFTAAGFVIHATSDKITLFVGFLLIAAGLTSMGFVSTFFGIGVCIFLITSAFGFFDTAVNSLASKTFTHQGRQMNLLHALYGGGAILGPIAAASAIAVTGTWKSIYLICLIPIVILFVVNIVLSKTTSITKVVEKIPLRTIFSNKFFWLFAIAFGLTPAFESQTLYWGSVWINSLSLDPSYVPLYLSTFFGLFTIGRLTSAAVVEKFGCFKVLGTCVLSMLVLYVLFTVLQIPLILAGLGLFVGPLFPTLMAYAFKYFKDEASQYTSFMFMIMAVINMTLIFAGVLGFKYVLLGLIGAFACLITIIRRSISSEI
jgi:fucose permease